MTEDDIDSKVTSYLKHLVSRRLSSLFEGFLSGLMAGIAVALIAFSQEVSQILSQNLMIFLPILATSSAVILCWGLYASFHGE